MFDPNYKRPNAIFGISYVLFVLFGSLHVWYKVFASANNEEYYWALAESLFLIISVWIIDLLISEAPYRNYELLRYNGYSHGYIWFSIFIMAINSYSSSLMMYFLFPHLKDEFQINLQVIILILINLGLGEVYFFSAHRYMHLYQPSWHHFHHCCLYSSYTTNWLFSPLDGFLEFAGPYVVLLLTHYFIHQNATASVLTAFIINLWYGFDHDEFLQLPHYSHHQYIDRIYTIYVKYRHKSHNDLVRKTVKVKKFSKK